MELINGIELLDKAKDLIYFPNQYAKFIAAEILVTIE